ncbi:MAG: putative immunity protein [Cellulosilyticaceae bacterium]
MAKPRKMLGSADSPYIISLMRLIETQSKSTISTWCMNYAEEHFLPIYVKSYPDDQRLQQALQAARSYLDGSLKLADAKKIIMEATRIGRELESDPIAQAAAKAVAQSAASTYTPTHSLSVAFFGAAAVAYDRVGLQENAATYDQIASQVCADLEEALQCIAIADEPNPAKINWGC